jgi:hypothetical protein
MVPEERHQMASNVKFVPITTPVGTFPDTAMSFLHKKPNK